MQLLLYALAIRKLLKKLLPQTILKIHKYVHGDGRYKAYWMAWGFGFALSIIARVIFPFNYVGYIPWLYMTYVILFRRRQ